MSIFFLGTTLNLLAKRRHVKRFLHLNSIAHKLLFNFEVDHERCV